MPSYEKGKRIRLPSISAKMNAITGVSADEKALLTRIGNLIDSYIVDREMNQPDGEARTLSPRIATPTDIIATPITGGIEVKWEEVDMKDLKTYEVQYSDTSTYAISVILPTSENRIILKALPALTVFIRVRAVSRRGHASLWASPITGGVTYSTSPFEVDTDHIDPENRTLLTPQPTLLGASLSVGAGSRLFLGVGGAVGPGPVSFTDTSDGGSTTLKNQITYSVLANSTKILQGALGLPVTFFDNFYEVVSREYTTASGSFIDFFYIEALLADPTTIDVRFLDYLQSPHEQTGTIDQATMSIVKH